MATYSPGWELKEIKYTLTVSDVTIYTCPANTYGYVGMLHIWQQDGLNYANITKHTIDLDGTGYSEVFDATTDTDGVTIGTHFTNFSIQTATSNGLEGAAIQNPWTGGCSRAGDSLYAGEYFQAEKSGSTGYLILYVWEYTW